MGCKTTGAGKHLHAADSFVAVEISPPVLKTRRDFLTRFFAILKERAIPYVVMRNFDAVFAEGISDVDLLSAESTPVFTAALDAAAETAHRLVQKTRFLNHSWVFWNGGESFTRLDIDTSIRWRIFPVASTSTALSRRLDTEDFSVPHPADEAILLRVNIAWRNKLEPRYADRLAALGEPVTTPQNIRRSILSNALSPTRWPSIARFVCDDLARFRQRKSSPPGLVFQLVTARAFDESKLCIALAAVFPPAKKAALEHAPAALFKGGLVVNIIEVAEDADLSSTAARLSPVGSHSRNYVGVLERRGRLHLANVGTGRMATVNAEIDAEQVTAKTILTMLADAEGKKSTATKGCSVLLIGIDGAGKTTFARGLCGAVPHQQCRYFHWIPSLADAPIFPWPSFTDQPRHRTRSGAVSSSFRLLRNLFRARIAWMFRVRPLVKGGALVLMDRFVANYWLDALSVRWNGPAWLLRWFYRLVPKADVMLILDAEPEVLATRKGELTLPEITAQRERLHALPALGKRSITLDAKQPPDAVIREALAKLGSSWK